jgi:hypothetical protein
VTTTTTTYHLGAVTDDLAARTHLGATEKANRTWCGVDLLVKDDPRFGGRYKDTVFTASTDLAAVDCRACKQSAAWKGAKGGKYTTPAPKAARSRAAAKAAGNAGDRLLRGPAGDPVGRAGPGDLLGHGGRARDAADHARGGTRPAAGRGPERAPARSGDVSRDVG